MLIIHEPRITNGIKHARLSADIEVDGRHYALWYEVQEEFAQYLCAERSDAFLIGLLKYALVNGHDVMCEAPVTASLLRKIRESFLPSVINADRGRLRLIKLFAPEAAPIQVTNTGVGTGFSGGVDSLFTILSHKDQITHLVVNKCHIDSERATGEAGYFNALIVEGEKFAQEMKLPLIIGNTNYDGEALPGLSFCGTHGYANAFGAYALQKLFTRYYIGCGHAYEPFSLHNFATSDCAEYELLLGYVFTTENLNIVLDGPVDRLEKVRMLATQPLAERFLGVCCFGPTPQKRNCTGLCYKCMRTVLELLAVESLDNFKEVFDVQYVQTHKQEFCAELLRLWLRHDVFAQEVWPYRRNMQFGLCDWCGASVIVLRKIIKKIVRGGATSHVFRPKG